MASALWYFALFLISLIAGLCDATDYNILNVALARKHELWMAEHGRVYKDEVERAHRFEIFRENDKYIEEFNNAGEHNYTLGLNKFADLTLEEFVATYTGAMAPEQGEFEDSHGSIKLENFDGRLNHSFVPSVVDWRRKGVVTRIKDQGGCGSCWAFAAVAAVESIIAIKRGILYSLSEQQLLDCDKYDNACKGGYTNNAFRYIIENYGLTTEANYPYKEAQGTCNALKARQTVGNINAYVKLPKNNEKAIMLAVARQPVAVQLEANKNLQLYKSGIFDGPCGLLNINHEVLIVGYDATGYNNHWVAKNSWGRGWGEDGYFRMRKDVSVPNGLCSMATGASYPVLFW